jgi:hypothetical protein
MHAHRHQDDGRAITTAIKRAYGLPTSAGRRSRTRTQINGECAVPRVEYATRNTTLLQSPYRIREDWGSHTRSWRSNCTSSEERGTLAADPWHATPRVRQHRNHTSRRPLHQNKRPHNMTTLQRYWKRSRDRPVGRKRYAYCATQIHGAPPEMGITHLVEVMEPNGARHDRAALRLLWRDEPGDPGHGTEHPSNSLEREDPAKTLT